MALRVGRHVGIGEGLLKGIAYGQRIGCRALQVFPGNPTGWHYTPLPAETAARVRAAAQDAGVVPLVIHAPYIINLAGPDEVLWARSREGLANCFRRAAEIGAVAIVLHVGSHRGAGPAEGLRRLSAGVNGLLAEHTGPVQLLLENSAGAGHTLGASFGELGELLAEFPAGRVGVCLDTAHVWGAGHDISGPTAGEALFEDLARAVDLKRVPVLHLNDSAVGLGSRRDVHARLGDGQIGLAGLAGVLRAFGAACPDGTVLLETPDDGPTRESGWQQLVACLLDGDLDEARARQAAIMALPIEKGSFPEDKTARSG
jgi:deoxyribonuclease-4